MTADRPTLVPLDFNMVATVPANSIDGTIEFNVSVIAPRLLDGRYQYKLVSVRKDDMDPYVELKSIPSKSTSLNLKNSNEEGRRTGNFIPVLSLPPVPKGNPERVDRIELYRKDPDVDEFVKVYEYSSQDGYTEFKDELLITDLDRIEFLSELKDELFVDINQAISNTSETFDKVFAKDNRLWLVPTSRKDLLLYSRAGDWWGWLREWQWWWYLDSCLSMLACGV